MVGKVKRSTFASAFDKKMEEIDLKDFFNYIKSKIIFIVILIIMFLAFVIIYDKNIKTEVQIGYNSVKKVSTDASFTLKEDKQMFV